MSTPNRFFAFFWQHSIGDGSLLGSEHERILVSVSIFSRHQLTVDQIDGVLFLFAGATFLLKALFSLLLLHTLEPQVKSIKGSFSRLQICNLLRWLLLEIVLSYFLDDLLGEVLLEVVVTGYILGVCCSSLWHFCNSYVEYIFIYL